MLSAVTWPTCMKNMKDKWELWKLKWQLQAFNCRFVARQGTESRGGGWEIASKRQNIVYGGQDKQKCIKAMVIFDFLGGKDFPRHGWKKQQCGKLLAGKLCYLKGSMETLGGGGGRIWLVFFMKTCEQCGKFWLACWEIHTCFSPVSRGATCFPLALATGLPLRVRGKVQGEGSRADEGRWGDRIKNLATNV